MGDSVKVIVAGPRNLRVDNDTVGRAIVASGFGVSEILEGAAPGVDSSAAYYAHVHEIPCRLFPADWKNHGKAAGPIRNREMAKHADALLVIKRAGIDSAGTSSMMREAARRGLPVHVYEVRG